MYAVTTDAGGDAGFALFLEQLAVDAGVILFLLINAQAGIESLNQVRIAVALAAISRDIERFWLTQIAFAGILGGFFCVRTGIAAMTIVA